MTGDDNYDGDHPKTSNPSPPVPPPTQQIPHTISSIKLLILKKGEYDIWAMKMEHYLSHTDYPIWQVIHNGKGPVFVTTYTNEMIKVLPSKTAEEVVAKERERKAMTTLLMALPEDHLAKFHKMVDAKKTWEAIKFRFGGNDEYKKMQKYLLKQEFEGFIVSASEGLHKGYDRFQTLLSKLEIHGAGVSHEDANQKFLRSLPSSWSQVALIMRTKPGLDTFIFDDLYNNLRVFERDVKGTIASSSNTQNVAFVYADNTNDVSTAYSVSFPSVSKSHKEGSSSYTDEVIHSFFANQSSAPQLDYDDLEQINDDDMQEMDLKRQTKVECFNCHKIGHFVRDYRAKMNQDSRRRDVGYNGNKARDNGRIPVYQDDSKALVTIDGEDIDRFGHIEEDAQNYAMMAYSFGNLGSDNEVKSCSKTCEESYARLKKLYDEKRNKLGDTSVEITAYTLALKKVTPKTSHLQAVKKIFRYPKGQPKLGLWYPKVSSFDLEAYSDSDYAGANLDRKSTTGGCQFLDKRFISCSPMSNPHQELTSPEANDFCKELASLKQTALATLVKGRLLDVTTKHRLLLPSIDGIEVTAGDLKLLLFKHIITTIVDFLNAQVIQYALMVNLTIYVSCIKQFWATFDKEGGCIQTRGRIEAIDADEDITLVYMETEVDLGAELHGRLEKKDEVNVAAKEVNAVEPKVFDDEEFWATVSIKKANDVVKLRALIDGKRVPPPKLTFYKAFFSAQWKLLIQTLVQCVSAKRTAWNKFSCSMAPAVICLATGRKFNFSKYIFDSMVRNVDSPSKFLMYPRFLQVIISAQVDDLSSHNNQYTSPALSQKVFANMRRVEGRIEAIDSDEEITLVDIETQVDLGAELQGRKDNNNAAIKDVSVVEPNVFDDEEVTMTMAQTLIKMKAQKARLLDEVMAKRLHDEEVEQAAAREKQEKDDLEKAKVLQQQKYQNLKRKPIFIAQARKNMIIYLKNMVGYKMENFRVEEPTKKRVAEETLLQESFKKLKAVEVSEAYQSFEDMLKGFDREDLNALWRLVKEKFNSAVPTVDKEKALWISSNEDFHGGQQTKEQKFGYILQVIKKLELKKLDGLLAGVDDVQRKNTKGLMLL
nr:hypothetical protein [Tanacetum cinerariifolium]